MLITYINSESNPKIGQLSGLSYVLKDIYITKGFLTSAGSQILEKYIPCYDSSVNTILKNKGAKLIGKSSLDEFSCGSLGINHNFKGINTPNPNNPNLFVGGSSSGSAYCVAKDICDFSLGSDTGGSVRLPAILCKIFGFKPSYGLISRYGMIPLCNDLDTVSIFSKSIKTLENVFINLCEYDNKDQTQTSKLEPLTKVEFKVLCQSKDYDFIKKLLPSLKIDVLDLDYSKINKFYFQKMLPYCFSNLNRYDGLKFNNSNHLVHKSYQNITNSRSCKLGNLIKARIIKGFEIHKDYLNNLKDISEFLETFRKHFKKGSIFISVFKDLELQKVYNKYKPILSEIKKK
jgi:aspartyl-tRNA(Asn)/glutamyl-tRNA(Gln) amidotransferase subunit A